MRTLLRDTCSILLAKRTCSIFKPEHFQSGTLRSLDSFGYERVESTLRDGSVHESYWKLSYNFSPGSDYRNACKPYCGSPSVRQDTHLVKLIEPSVIYSQWNTQPDTERDVDITYISPDNDEAVTCRLIQNGPRCKAEGYVVGSVRIAFLEFSMPGEDGSLAPYRDDPNRITEQVNLVVNRIKF